MMKRIAKNPICDEEDSTESNMMKRISNNPIWWRGYHKNQYDDEDSTGSNMVKRIAQNSMLKYQLKE